MRATLFALASGLALVTGLVPGDPALAGGPTIMATEPEPAPALPPARAAVDWSGSYVDLGYGRTSGDFDLGPLATPPVPATPRSLTDGTALSLHAGYLFQRGALVYGGELALSRLSGTTLPCATDEEVDKIIDLKARAGYAANRVLVYGVLGYMQIHWASPGPDAFSETGPVFGLGLDFAASDRLTVGLEYLARRTSGRFDPPGRDFDLNVDTLSLRVGLCFRSTVRSGNRPALRLGWPGTTWGPWHMSDTLPASGIDRLLAIMAALRDPRTGCPWDIEQTFATIAPYTLEEAHEVADAIERADWPDLKGELGDLLFQTVYHSQMAAEAGHFTFADVVTTISDKMIARHPHVFGEGNRDKTAEQQTRDWEAQKARERGTARTLDGIAAALPALTRALKLQNRAARVGFDWPSTGEVLDKLVEEAREVVEARDTLTHADLTEEIGDLLFVMANLARHLKVDPEAALRAANQKFTRRFARIEDWLAEQGRTPADSDLAEMDALWNRAKAEDKRTA